MADTRKQDESTTYVLPLSLQNLHPRFKSGRRLQNPICLVLPRERVAHTRSVHLQPSATYTVFCDFDPVAADGSACLGAADRDVVGNRLPAVGAHFTRR